MFLDLGDQPHCDALLRPEDLVKQEPCYPLQVCFCHECTTVQINHTIPKEIMFEEFLYLSGTTQTLKNHFQVSSDFLVNRLNLKKEDLVVDIGSNDGTWLACYGKYKLKTLGVDPAKNIAKLANERGIETWDKFFDAGLARKIISKKGRAKLITASGVFFHLEELHSVTDGIRELLDDDGVFCVQSIYLGSIIKNTQFDQIYHEHLTYWTVKSLQALFDLHRLEIFSVRLLKIHGGSLELLVARKGSREINSSVKSFLDEEKYFGYDNIQTYNDFSNRVWKIQKDLVDIIISYRSNKKIVYAFAAPAKGATLLNSFGITNEMVKCAVEANPLKIGKYIPGCRIPIVDEKTTPDPDVYLLLAWNFIEEILKKKQDYISNGGEFIIPVPNPPCIIKCLKQKKSGIPNKQQKKYENISSHTTS
jgi:hypothetical protein